MTVSFITPGKFDLDHVFTFGMSVKETENPIGFFGTGLKFAIATLLRTGHEITLLIGNERHEFRTEETQFRGKSFLKVFLDNHALNFTTELGKTWEVWMAYRELESNTRDEKGRTISKEATKAEIGDEGSAIIVKGDGIDLAHADKDIIFCSSPVLAKNDKLEIRSGGTPFIFYRGVRVGKTQSTSIFTYNLLGQEDLTEDRTLKYEWYAQTKIAQEVARVDGLEVMRRVLAAPLGTFEHGMNFDGANPGDDFIKITKECWRDSFLNLSARKLARTLDFFVEPEIDIDDIQKKQMDRAVEFLGKLGFNVKEYPIKIMKLHGAMGQAKSGTIFIDPSAFRMGTKQLAGTLFEEWFHLSEGCRDETREMQNFLIDTMLSLGEKIIGEPI